MQANRPRGPQSSPTVNMLEMITPPDSAGEEDLSNMDYMVYDDTMVEESNGYR